MAKTVPLYENNRTINMRWNYVPVTMVSKILTMECELSYSDYKWTTHKIPKFNDILQQPVLQ